MVEKKAGTVKVVSAPSSGSSSDHRVGSRGACGPIGEKKRGFLA